MIERSKKKLMYILKSGIQEKEKTLKQVKVYMEI